MDGYISKPVKPEKFRESLLHITKQVEGTSGNKTLPEEAGRVTPAHDMRPQSRRADNRHDCK